MEIAISPVKTTFLFAKRNCTEIVNLMEEGSVCATVGYLWKNACLDYSM